MTYLNLAKALHTEASHRDDEDNKPRKNPSIGAMVALARLLDGCSLYDAFGAPGDWGYETAVGEALASLYRAPDARPKTARISFGPVASLVEEFTAANDALRAENERLRAALASPEATASSIIQRLDAGELPTGNSRVEEAIKGRITGLVEENERLRTALDGVIDYAQSRAEDLHESGGDACEYWQKADSAVDAARAVLAKGGAL